jgi:hypothetical protein
MFLDRRAERLAVIVRPLTAVVAAWAGPGWSDGSVLVRDRAVGNEIDRRPPRDDAL